MDNEYKEIERTLGTVIANKMFDKRRADRRIKQNRETVDIPKYKMVRDGVLSIPKQNISAPTVSVDLIRNEIKIQKNHYGENIEVMVIVLLSIDNYPILAKTIGIGSASHVYVDPKVVMGYVSSPQFNAEGFVLGHNHPSGHTFLSEEDKVLLKQFQTLGELVHTPLRDFIVIGDGTNEYYSHRNEHYDL